MLVTRISMGFEGCVISVVEAGRCLASPLVMGSEIDEERRAATARWGQVKQIMPTDKCCWGSSGGLP